MRLDADKQKGFDSAITETPPEKRQTVERGHSFIFASTQLTKKWQKTYATNRDALKGAFLHAGRHKYAEESVEKNANNTKAATP